MYLEKLHGWKKKFVIALWILAGLSIFSIWLIFYNISRGDLPTFEQLENPKYKLASLVYDCKGREIGKYFIENRENVEFDSINPYLINALISTEDSRYYSHSGVDFKAIFRVLGKTLLMRHESSGGGSTISQQLAKLLFRRPDLRKLSKFQKAKEVVIIKFKEWITAVKLEKSYTKEEIIEMYLNKFDFIYGAHGIQAASHIYFGKDQKDLNIEEAATLIGMLKNPALFNPKRFTGKAQKRRNIVLSQLYKYDKIDKKQLDSITNIPINISKFNKESHDIGPAPYFRMELTKWLKKLFVEKNIKKPDGTEYNIYTDGLKIYSTIDLDYQRDAEKAVFDHMKEMQKRYWKVWRGMNPLRYHIENHRQLEARKYSIENRIINSERYQAIKRKYLSEILNKIYNKFDGLILNEKASFGLVKVKEGKKTLKRLVRERIVKDSSVQKLNDLLNNDLWNIYKEKWDLFQKEKNKEFDTKIKMKVFAYNDKMETDTVMSPRDSVIYHLRHLQTGMLAMEPGTGHIKAWVGGIGFKYFKFDHINNRRQVGSTFKPIVYATAISVQGLSPCQEFEDIQYSIVPGEGNFYLKEEWTPANASGKFTGNKYNLYQGLLYSKNSITVRLVKELGNIEVVRDLANNMGIDKDKKINGAYLLPKVPAIALGAADLSVMEMTGAYGTFANDGVYTKPVFVSRIEDKNGRIIYTEMPKRKRALNSMYNYIMVDMLKNNVAGRFLLEGVKSEIGGKTGTTNDYADGWFMSITPNIVTGVWTGGDEKWVRFYTLQDGQGFVMARPIVQKFIYSLENDTTITFDYNKRFKTPDNPKYKDMIDCGKHKEIKPEEEQEMRLEEKVEMDEFDEEFDEEFEELDSIK